MRLQLNALAYNLGNFMRTLAMPKAAEPWSLTSPREFADILSLIAGCGTARAGIRGVGVRCDSRQRQRCQATSSSASGRPTRGFGWRHSQMRSNFVAARLDGTENRLQKPRNLGNVYPDADRLVRANMKALASNVTDHDGRDALCRRQRGRVPAPRGGHHRFARPTAPVARGACCHVRPKPRRGARL